MIAVTVKKRGRFVTNPEGVKHDIQTAAERGMFKGWQSVRKSIREKMSIPGTRHPFWGRIGSADGLMVRTGKTRASLTPAFRPLRIGNRVTASVGSPDQHVLDLEEGGTVSAGSGWFRIPTAAAQTAAAGVDRWAGMSIRDIPGAHLYRNQITHRLWAYQVEPGALGTGKHRLLYLLTKSVTRKGRHIFARTAAEQAPVVAAAMGREVSLAVQKANS